MKKRVLMSACLLPFLLPGCATTTEYGHKIGSWIGHSVDDLYSMLGTPTSTEPQADGGKIVTYEKTEVVRSAPGDKVAPPATPGTTSQAAAAATEPANTRTVSCTTRYKTDSTGVVRSWTFDGEGCKAHEAPAPQQP